MGREISPPPVGRMGNFAAGIFFIGWWEPEEEWFWTFEPFSKVKITFKIKLEIKISMTYVCKEYKIWYRSNDCSFDWWQGSSSQPCNNLSFLRGILLPPSIFFLRVDRSPATIPFVKWRNPVTINQDHLFQFFVTTNKASIYTFFF